MLPLHALGERILVMGPSNAGKSTLALALSEKLDLPAIHLDQLHHLPNTDWEPRPEEEFKALHDEAILADRWVMEGNYSRLMPQRFERATGAILLTSNKWLRLGRYFKRTLINEADRAGHLEGARDHLKWSMIDWIVFKTPGNALRYEKMLKSASLALVQCRTVPELKSLYQEWELKTPG